MKFNDIDEDCFSSDNDVSMKLFPQGLKVPANSISGSSNTTTVEFNFNIDAKLPKSFSPTYTVKTKDNNQGSQGSFLLGTDNQPPSLTHLSTSPSKELIKPNTTIKINYAAEDTQSGLKSFEITGSAEGKIDLNGSSKHEGTYSEKIKSSKKYTIKVQDMLSNSLFLLLY